LEVGEIKRLEDYDDFTEVDTGGYITKANDKITWTNLPVDASTTAYCYLSETVTDPVWQMRFKFRVTSIDTNASATEVVLLWLWGVSENLGRLGHSEVGQNLKIGILEKRFGWYRKIGGCCCFSECGRVEKERLKV